MKMKMNLKLRVVIGMICLLSHSIANGDETNVLDKFKSADEHLNKFIEIKSVAKSEIYSILDEELKNSDPRQRSNIPPNIIELRRQILQKARANRLFDENDIKFLVKYVTCYTRGLVFFDFNESAGPVGQILLELGEPAAKECIKEIKEAEANDQRIASLDQILELFVCNGIISKQKVVKELGIEHPLIRMKKIFAD